MSAPTNLSMFRLVYLTCLLFSPILCSQSAPKKIITIHASLLDSKIHHHDYVLAYFFRREGCDTCAQVEQELDLTLQESLTEDLVVYKIDSVGEASKLGIANFPGIVYFRKAYPIVYEGKMQAEDMMMWIEQHREMATQKLDDENFEHLTQVATGATTGDWLVLFFEPSCAYLMAQWEAIAHRLKSRMNVAKVDYSYNPKLVKRFNIKKCPTVLFFRLGSMYAYQMNKYDTESLVTFASGGYRNFPAVKVHAPETPFDELTTRIAASLKHHLSGPNIFLIAALSVTSFFVFLIVVFFCITGARTDFKKQD